MRRTIKRTVTIITTRYTIQWEADPAQAPDPMVLPAAAPDSPDSATQEIAQPIVETAAPSHNLPNHNSPQTLTSTGETS